MTGADVSLTLAARPENVAVVRRALGGVADVLGIEGDLLADMRLAVTEACTNVVVHAYREPGGVLEVELRPAGSGITVVVRDEGSGIHPSVAAEDSSALGLGLPLMAALATDFEVHGGEDGGTEVRMTFDYDPPGEQAA